MEWPLALSLLFGMLLVSFAIGLPVAFAFLAVNIVGIYLFLGGVTGLSLLGGSAFAAIAQFALIPIPLFLLMGEILMRSGLARDTIHAADQWIGRVPGRLSVSAVAGGTVFGAISGSSMASVAVLGSILVPEMRRQRYGAAMIVPAILGAGGLAVLIPPSALGVLLGALAKVSIGDLLIASALPGFILALFYAIYFVTRAVLQPDLAPSLTAKPLSLRERLKTVGLLVELGGLMVVVTGLIFFGVCTPSESAALGVVASMTIAAMRRQISPAVIKDAAMATAKTTSMILLIIVGSTALSQLLAATGATSGLVETLVSFQMGPIATIIIMQAIVFILGCFIDTISIMMVTVPIFYPILQSLGVDPIWFSVMFLIQLELAGITPPFGVLLFVFKGLAPDFPTKTIYYSIIPIVLIQLSVVCLIVLFPTIATWAIRT